MIDLPAIRDRDAETERFPYRNPIPDGQRAIQDRRALLAEVDVLIRERDSAREALRVSEQHVRELGAHIESLQSRWASRPLSHPDGEALAKENERLRAELAIVTRDRDTLLQMTGKTVQQVADEINRLRSSRS